MGPLSIFDDFVKRYFDTMSKASTETIEQRVVALERVKEEFLNVCYSPLFDGKHILFLGLLNDATYMLKKQTTRTKKTRVTVPETNAVTISKKKDTVVSLKTKRPIFLDNFARTERFSQRNLAGFGETVYLPQHLRAVDITVLNINTDLINNTVKFEFLPEQYLLNNTAYDMNYHIFYGSGYMITAAYTYLVDKHYKDKERIYGSNNVNKPQFFEIFYEPLLPNAHPISIHVQDLDFIGDDEYFQKIVTYIENTPVCFTSFILTYNLSYIESGGNKIFN